MFSLPEERPAVMGVLNVTPDSFSDGGQYTEMATAIDHGMRMLGEGADLIDVGGESTRPGSRGVSLEEESGRVLPVVRELCRRGAVVSVDTSKAEVARRALLVGATVVNDVTAGRDPQMFAVCADAACHLCLMHMQGEPRTMQVQPTYTDVVEEVREFLDHRAAAAEEAGVLPDRLWLDPGIGFGKSLRHNLSLLRRLDRLVSLGRPVLVGVSRKSFLGHILEESEPGGRLEGALAAQTLAQAAGVRVLRTHDVTATVKAVKVASAVLHA